MDIPIRKVTLNQLCNIVHGSERLQAMDPHLYTCKKDVFLSSHFCAPRAATKKKSFLCLVFFMREEFGFECNSGLGLNPSFKMAVIAEMMDLITLFSSYLK